MDAASIRDLQQTNYANKTTKANEPKYGSTIDDTKLQKIIQQELDKRKYF